MLDPDVHPLLDVSVADDLVDDDTNSTGSDIVDNASSTVVTCKSCVRCETRSRDEPMVVFVRHALLLGSVGLDVNNVTNPVVKEVCREFDVTLLCKSEVSERIERDSTKPRTLEFALEEIAGTRPVTERVRHFEGSKT